MLDLALDFIPILNDFSRIRLNLLIILNWQYMKYYVYFLL